MNYGWLRAGISLADWRLPEPRAGRRSGRCSGWILKSALGPAYALNLAVEPGLRKELRIGHFLAVCEQELKTMTKPKIVAYLKPMCGWSQGVRAVLRKYGLPYEDRDIINDPLQRQEMIEKSGQM